MWLYKLVTWLPNDAVIPLIVIINVMGILLQTYLHKRL